MVTNFDLTEMLEAVRELDTADNLPPQHRRFLARGSSLGGARPKATTTYKLKLWIAKFGRAHDRYPMCRAEYVAERLAFQQSDGNDFTRHGRRDSGIAQIGFARVHGCVGLLHLRRERGDVGESGSVAGAGYVMVAGGEYLCGEEHPDRR